MPPILGLCLPVLDDVVLDVELDPIDREDVLRRGVFEADLELDLETTDLAVSSREGDSFSERPDADMLSKRLNYTILFVYCVILFLLCIS